MTLNHSLAQRALRCAAAAVVCLLVGVTCRDGTGPGDGPGVEDRSGVASLVTSRDTVAFLDIGDTLELRAEARDSAGAAVRAAAVAWRTLEPSVAEVSAAGVVRATGGGTAHVVVTAGRRADTVVVQVRPAVTSVVVAPHADTIWQLNGTLRAVATAFVGERAERRDFVFTTRDNTVAAPYAGTTADTAVIRGGSSGSTYIVAQERGGRSDSVLVVVRQRPSRVELRDHALAGAAGRSVQGLATVFDAGGSQIPGAPVAWTSRDETIAAVNGAGAVSLLAEGSTTIVASAANGTADSAIVTVGARPQIQFATAAVTVGVGQLTENLWADGVPTSGSTIQLVSSDPAVAAVPATVTPASSNGGFRVRGVAPGSALVIASAPGLRPDTLAVLVRPSRLRISDLMNVLRSTGEMAPGLEVMAWGEVIDSAGVSRPLAGAVSVSVRTSDSSVVRITGVRTVEIAAGGTGSTGTYLKALSPGWATVYFESSGFGTDSIALIVGQRPKLSFLGPSTQLIGLGQTTRGAGATYGRPLYVGTTAGYRDSKPLALTIERRHPEVAEAPSALTIASNAPSAPYDISGLALGTDTLIASAAGYDPDTLVLVVTTPRLVVSERVGPLTVTTNGGPIPEVYVADSLGQQHASIRPLALRVQSSDTTVLRADDTQLPAQWNAWWLIPIRARSAGRATVTVSDPAGVHAAQSFTTEVRVDSTLRIGANPGGWGVIGARQRFEPNQFYVLRGGSEPRVDVAVRSTNPAVLRVPGPTSIAENVLGAAVQVVGGDVPGTARLIAEAPGFVPDTSELIEVGTPRFELLDLPDTAYVGATVVGVRVSTRDQRGNYRSTDEDVRVSLGLVGPAGSTDSASLTVRAGANTSGRSGISFRAPGTARVVAYDPRVASYAYAPDTAAVVVALPPLAISPVGFARGTVGVGQELDLIVRRPFSVAGSSVTTALSATTGRLAAPSTATIAGGSVAQQFTVTATSAGADTLVAIAEDYVSGRFAVSVTDGTVTMVGFSTGYELRAGDSVAVRFRTGDAAGDYHRVAAATTFEISTTGGVVVTNGAGQTLDKVTVGAGSDASATVFLKAVTPGASSLTLRHLRYSTRTISVSVRATQ